MAFWGKSFGEIGTLFKTSFGDAFADINSKFDMAVSGSERFKASVSGIGQGIKSVFTQTKDSPFELMTDDEAKQRILDFAQAFDNGAVGLQKFNNELKNKGMKAYLSQVDAGKASLEGYKSYVIQANAALQKTSLASKAAAVGMKALNAALNMGVMLAVSYAIQKLTEWIDNLIHKQELLEKQAEELRNKYEETTSELEKVNSELESTQKRIDELNSKEKLTFTEKDELDKLQKTNSELQTRIDLLQKQAKIESQDSNDALKTSYLNEFENPNEVRSRYLKGEEGEAWVKSGRATELEGQYYIGEKDYYLEQIRYYKELKNAKQELTSSQKKELAETEEYLIEYANRFDELAQKVIVVDNESASFRETLLSLASDGNVALSGTIDKAKAFSEIFDGNFKSVKNELFELSKSGKLNESIISDYKGLKEAIESVGLSVSDVVDEFNALSYKSNFDLITEQVNNFTAQIDSAKSAVEQFKDTMDDLADIMEKAASGQELSGKQIVDLLQKYPELDSAVISTTNGYKLQESAVKRLVDSKVAQNRLDIEDSIKAAKKVLEAEGIKLAGYNGTTKGIEEQIRAQITLLKSQYTDIGIAGGGFKDSLQVQKIKELQNLLDTIKQGEVDLKNIENITKYIGNSSKYSGASITSSKNSTNEALQNALKKIEHDKAMGLYDKKELQYIADLEAAKNKFAKKEEERWDIDEKIYRARLDYEERLKKEQEDAKKAAEEAAKAQKDALNAINDLAKKRVEMIKKEKEEFLKAEKSKLDALKKEIDKRKELLDQQKEDQDNEKELAEKNQAIADLEIKIKQQSLDTSAEGQKKLKELEEELANKQQDLNEYLANRNLEIQKEALDEEYAKHEEQYNKLEESTNQYLDNNKALMEQAMNDLNGMSQSMLDQLIGYNEKYGDGIRSTIVGAWEAAKKALQEYGDLASVSGTFNKLDNAISNGAVYRPNTTTQNSGTTSNAPPSSPAPTKKSPPSVGSTITMKETTKYFGSKSGNKHVNSRVVPGKSFTVYQVSGDQVLIGRNGTYTGWVKLSDIKGYASGINKIPYSQTVTLDENGPELVLKAKKGRLDHMEYGGSVIPADITKRLMELASNPPKQNISIPLPSGLNDIKPQHVMLTVNEGDINIKGSVDDTIIEKFKNAKKEINNDMYKEMLRGLSNRGSLGRFL